MLFRMFSLRFVHLHSHLLHHLSLSLVRNIIHRYKSSHGSNTTSTKSIRKRTSMSVCVMFMLCSCHVISCSVKVVVSCHIMLIVIIFVSCLGGTSITNFILVFILFFSPPPPPLLFFSLPLLYSMYHTNKIVSHRHCFILCHMCMRASPSSHDMT